MKIRSFLRFFEPSKPQSFEEYVQEHLENASSEQNHQAWMDLWEHKKAKEGEQQ